MANRNHLYILQHDFDKWNRWRAEDPEKIPDLRAADLSQAYLRAADLSRAYLREADLSRADLSRANLSRANLRRADLSRANLSRANLSRADLRRADLREANLREADLSEADLSRANLSRADLSRANLSRANLSRANLSHTDLDQVKIMGESTGVIELSLTLDRDFDSFGESEKQDFVKRLRHLVTDNNNIEITNVKCGGINLTLKVSCEQAEQILWFFRRRELESLGIINTNLISDEAVRAIIESKVNSQDFDVFLWHNSNDKREVKEIGIELRKQAILPWLDEWELRPGVPWQPSIEAMIKTVTSAAIFVGKSGVGPWQEMEYPSHIQELVSRNCPVISVLLPCCDREPELPNFLTIMTVVDFRDEGSNPMQKLIWAIMGETITI